MLLKCVIFEYTRIPWKYLFLIWNFSKHIINLIYTKWQCHISLSSSYKSNSCLAHHCHHIFTTHIFIAPSNTFIVLYLNSTGNNFGAAQLDQSDIKLCVCRRLGTDWVGLADGCPVKRLMDGTDDGRSVA